MECVSESSHEVLFPDAFMFSDACGPWKHRAPLRLREGERLREGVGPKTEGQRTRQKWILWMGNKKKGTLQKSGRSTRQKSVLGMGRPRVVMGLQKIEMGFTPAADPTTPRAYAQP